MHSPLEGTRGHDRLGRVLHALRMRSTLYCHAELGHPWALEMPALEDSMSFHVVTAGSCWLKLPNADSIGLRAGDLALVPHGLGHAILSVPDGESGPRVDKLPQQYLSDHYSKLSYGGEGVRTQLICGVVTFDSPAARELMRTLPEVLSIGGDTVSPASAIRDTLRIMAGELSQPQLGGEAVATRLADIIVVQAIRGWLTAHPAAATGWIRALRDEYVGRALEAIHDNPGLGWNVERLAQLAVMSRSSFSARFAELVGVAPITYLARWRMSVAQSRLLADEHVPIGVLASELGYSSEAAFNRAFSRIVGCTPGSLRKKSR